MSYADAWKEDRRLWKRFLRCWMGGPVAFVVLSVLSSGVLGPFLSAQQRNSVSEGVFLLVGISWALGFLLTASDLFQGFRCPRCTNLFYTKGLFCNNFARRCLHCRLRKGAVEEPDGTREGSAHE